MPDQEKSTSSVPLLSQKAQVIVECEGRILATHQLDKSEITVGKLPRSTIFLADRQIARVHAIIRWIEDRWVIEDRGAPNRLKYNDKWIEPHGQHILRDGDRIFLGSSVALCFQSMP